MNQDYFAELYVSGILANNGWNIYFPHRDQGFDFIISKNINGNEIIRPVQVKGKYSTVEKTDKDKYGYVGPLSKVHKEMVLIIPFFNSIKGDISEYIAYMYYKAPNTEGIFKYEPAKFKSGKCIPRREYQKYFNERGLELMENSF